MIKSILGGKSKNLFDISKADVMINANIFNPIPAKWDCFYKMPVTSGQTYTVSCDTTTNAGVGTQLQLSAQTGNKWNEGTRLFVFLTSEEMVKDWTHIKATFTIPENVTQVTFSSIDNKFFRNFQIELGSTATEYVPHELTSYKSIMKVSDGRFVTSFDERMPCKTKNLFDKSNAQIINGYILENNVFSESSLDKTIIVPCLPNTTYTFSKISSVSPVVCDRLRIGDYTAIPTIGDTINNVVNIGEPPTQNYITITTSDTAKYIVVTIGLFNYKVITTLDYILSTCQLELGTTATDYVPYGYV